MEARRLSAETGIRHSVDHIIPLCGRTVTGLHVETNLRIITLEQNIRKGNRWDND
jgi:5-methylcytosine-specific restriction endonuclease McrA